MNEQLKEQLLEYGVLVDEAVRRFMGKEDLYQKFVFKFLSDASYQKLMEHLDANDYEEAFKDVHTLKGVTANLGLEPLREILAEMTELLRNKAPEDVDAEQVNEQREELKKKYERFTEIIKSFE